MEAMERLVSVKRAAAETGLTTHTLRAWERRFHRPLPVRLPSGHRRYTIGQVRWLRSVAEAIARGLRPSKVLPMAEGDLRALLARTVAPTGAARASAGTEELIRLAADDRIPLLIATLRRSWKALDPVEFLDGRMVPLLRALGRRWAEGRLEIRREHAASAAIGDLLRGLRLRIRIPPRAPGIVLATLPGERHELGLQMAALLCAREGFRVHLLGSETPFEEIAAAARETRAQAVGLSVSLASGGAVADREIALLREGLPASMGLIVGGEGARGIRRGIRGAAYPADLGALREWLRALSAVAGGKRNVRSTSTSARPGREVRSSRSIRRSR